jgi:hypothetical protein
MKEVVRSGRRANFYITENSFIDHYAGDVGTTGVAVYHVLQRHANCETHSTWIGTAKMATLLKLDQRTIQRTIKKLESLRLIRIVRSENMTTFYIDPVPPRAKTTATPLFDEMPKSAMDQGDTDVAGTTPLSRPTTVMSPGATPSPREATLMPTVSDIHVALYKEEQNSSNKTQEQDLLNNTSKENNVEIIKHAQSIIKALKLSDSFMSAAIAAIEQTKKYTKQSMDGIVNDIVTEANHAARKGIERHEFLEEFLAEKSARRMLRDLSLPVTNNFVSSVTAAVKAEVAYRGLSVGKVETLIRSAALEDTRRGITIDRFYFENVKWRNGNAGHKPSASQQRSERTKQNILDGIAAEIGRRNKSNRPEQ